MTFDTALCFALILNGLAGLINPRYVFLAMIAGGLMGLLTKLTV